MLLFSVRNATPYRHCARRLDGGTRRRYPWSMSRVPQVVGEKGSLLWIQRAIAERWPSLETPILDKVGSDQTIFWRSPLEADGYAEYRDGAFLARLIHRAV
jgi:hypothetical protein